MISPSPRLLVLGAHPDDAEFHAGGLVCLYRQLGRPVKMVSVTDGGAGHHEKSAAELVPLRRAEAVAAGRVIGATYETWDFPDGRLLPTLEVRERIIREIRHYQPDLVLTHRPCDYHPDHRAVAQAVQDASYLVTIPLVAADVPALRCDPVVAYLPDLFTRPVPLRADHLVEVAPHLETIVQMLACHQSQVFEWLAFEGGILGSVPSAPRDRLAWLKTWYTQQIRPRADRYRDALIATLGEPRGREIDLIEMFEISEYASQPNEKRRDTLFPA
jgi:LmbE family N-acetylglucosaminyl deacetylase